MRAQRMSRGVLVAVVFGLFACGREQAPGTPRGQPAAAVALRAPATDTTRAPSSGDSAPIVQFPNCDAGPGSTGTQLGFVVWKWTGGAFRGDPRGFLPTVGADWEGDETADTVMVVRSITGQPYDSVTILARLAPMGETQDSLGFDMPMDSLATWRRVPPAMWQQEPRTLDAWQTLGNGPDTTPYTVTSTRGDTSHRGTLAHWMAVGRLDVPRLIEWGRRLQPTRVAVVGWRGGRCSADSIYVIIPV
jgi:hypothetical protein